VLTPDIEIENNSAMPLPAPVQRLVDRSFGVDLRSLALFRALLAMALIVDLSARLGGVRVFYADAGTLPRGALLALGESWRVCLHLANGGSWFAALLIVIELLAAVALLFGWHSRRAAALCFVLQASLLNRNPLLLVGGDTLLTALLFWSVLLPIGEYWSVDGALADAPPQHRRVCAWASAGLVLQVLSPFFFGALLLRAGAESGAAFTATLGRLPASPHAQNLLGDSGFAVAMAASALTLLPLLSVLRTIAVLLLLALVAALLLLGLPGSLPWLAAIGSLALLDGRVWDAGLRRLLRPRGGALRIYYDGEMAGGARTSQLLRSFLILPQAHIAPAQDNARANTLLQSNRSWVVIDHDDHAYLKWSALVLLLKRSPLFAPAGHLLGGVWAVRPANALYDWLQRRRPALARLGAALLPYRRRGADNADRDRLLQTAAALMLALLLAWNIGTLSATPSLLSRVARAPLRLLRIDQNWNAATLLPVQGKGWYLAPAQLADGRELDLLHPRQAAFSYAQPGAQRSRYDGLRWRVYLQRLHGAEFPSTRAHFARYLCRHWNAGHGATDAVKSFRLIYVAPAPDGAPGALEQDTIWQQDCGAGIDANAQANMAPGG
jgi:hypothetical protein